MSGTKPRELQAYAIHVSGGRTQVHFLTLRHYSVCVSVCVRSEYNECLSDEEETSEELTKAVCLESELQDGQYVFNH